MDYKKVLSFFAIFFVFLHFSYSFEVFDGSDNKREYFSFLENNVIVKHNSDKDLLFVDYELTGSKMTKSFPFSKCGKEYCAYFSIGDFFDGIDKDTITISSVMNLRVDSFEKKIFFDAIPPILKSESKLDKEGKKIVSKINYNENSKIKHLLIFLKGKVIQNYTSFDTEEEEIIYNYSLSEQGSYSFVFEIEDMAGNKKTQNEKIEVGDIFEPVLENFKLEKLLDKFRITFFAKDDTLISFALTSIDSGKENKKSVSKQEENFEFDVNLDSKIFKINIEDSSKNILKKEIDLTQKIEIKNFTKKTNKQKISFESSGSSSCEILELNNEKYEKRFKKSNFSFESNLNNRLIEGGNKIKILCNKDFFYEEMEYEVLYDETPPKKIDLILKEITSNTSTFSWDNTYEKNLHFELFKDEERIYLGNENSFIDKNISYPNKYIYYLKIFDEFENFIHTDKIEVIPPPDKVIYETKEKEKTVLNQSNYTFSFSVLKNSTIFISLVNRGEKYFSKNFTNKQENVSLPLILKEGKNEVVLKIVDEYKNELEKSYLISYNNPDKKIKLFFSNIVNFIPIILITLALILVLVLIFLAVRKIHFNLPKKVHKILKEKESKSTLNFDNEISKRKEYYKKLRESRKKAVQKKEKLQEVKEESLENRKVEDYSLKTKEISILLFKIQKYNTLSKDIFGKKYLENLIFGIEKKIIHFGGTLIREKKGEFMIIFGAPRTHSDLTNISGAVNLCLELKKEVSQINKLILKSYEEEDEKLINKEKIDFSCLIVFDKFKVGNFGGVNFFDYDVSGELVPVITKKNLYFRKE